MFKKREKVNCVQITKDTNTKIRNSSNFKIQLLNEI